MTDGLAVVTGAAGFIGSHLCDRLLTEGRRVVGVDDLSSGRIANLAEARAGDFTFEHLDVRDEVVAALLDRYRPDVIFHLAARACAGPSMEDPKGDAEVNVLGTLNLLEAASRAGTRKVVFASSGLAIYGEPRRLPVKETAAASSHPLSPHGVAKRSVDEYLRFYHRYRGLDFTSLALASVYGPRQDPAGEGGVVAAFIRRMLDGEAPTVKGDGNQTRDFVYVDDAVHAFSLAAGAGSGRLLNVGTGLETSVNHLYRMLAGITGFGAEPSFAPPGAGTPHRIALDPSLAERELGWKPWTHLDDGLGQTVDALRA